MSFVLMDELSQRLSNSLSSFWIYVPFTITAGHKVQLVSAPANGNGVACRVAVLIDGGTSTALPPQPRAGLAAGGHGLKITHESDGSISCANLMYEGAVEVKRDGEWAQLRLFRGVANDGANWVSTSGWTKEAFSADEDTNLWKRTFHFGAISGADLDATTIDEDQFGRATAVSLVRRMDRHTILAQLLSVSGVLAPGANPMHTLKIETKAPDKSKLPSLPATTLLTGANRTSAQGYVMIAAGAFAAISADAMLADWDAIATAAVAKRRLAGVAWSPDNVSVAEPRLLRKLNNIHENGRSGVFEGSGMVTDPVEVLYVKGTDPGAVIA